LPVFVGGSNGANVVDGCCDVRMWCSVGAPDCL
jgi:hypothetical protein